MKLEEKKRKISLSRNNCVKNKFDNGAKEERGMSVEACTTCCDACFDDSDKCIFIGSLSQGRKVKHMTCSIKKGWPLPKVCSCTGLPAFLALTLSAAKVNIH